MSEIALVNFETHHLRAGAIAGVIAGVIFGIIMGMMGMLPMVGRLVGAESAIAGFVVHVIISAVIGIIFAMFFGHEARTRQQGFLSGLLYGLMWWIVGPLIVMPLWLGMGTQVTGAGMAGALPSLWGHLVFGLILGLVYPMVAQQVEEGEHE